MITLGVARGDNDRDRRRKCGEGLKANPSSVARLEPPSTRGLPRALCLGDPEAPEGSEGPNAILRLARGGWCATPSALLRGCGVASVPSKREVPGGACLLNESGVLVLII